MTKYTAHLPLYLAQDLDPATFGIEPCMISITDRYEKKAPLLSDGWYKVHRTQFYDLEVTDGTGCITPEEAKEIAQFIRENWDHHIAVHCHAGVSRSAAVAEILTLLGWEPHPTFDFYTTFANNTVRTYLKRQFPELLPIGVEVDGEN